MPVAVVNVLAAFEEIATEKQIVGLDIRNQQLLRAVSLQKKSYCSEAFLLVVGGSAAVY
jgi:uncharacterized OsmC-like protein